MENNLFLINGLSRCANIMSKEEWYAFCINRGFRFSYKELMNLNVIKEMENKIEKSIVIEEEYISKVINRYYLKYLNGSIQKTRIAHIVMGLPASGKSTLLKKFEGIICDADLIKEQMYEYYDNGKGNEACHDASKIIFDRLLDELSDDGYRLAIPIIGKTKKSFDKIYDLLVSKGYKIVIKYIEFSMIEALNRSLKRFIEEGRYVSLSYINSINPLDIENVYNEVKDYPNVIRCIKIPYNNNYVLNRIYDVEAKCGHVGINRYVVKHFVVFAKDGKEAASIGRFIPRVKHDHKDAIRSVKEIGVEEGYKIRVDNDNDNYLLCSNIREQNEMCLDIDYQDEIKELSYKTKDKERIINNNRRKEKDGKRQIINYKKMYDIE